MDVLPRDVTIDLETPCAADAHLPFDERGRRAGDATRRFLGPTRRAGDSGVPIWLRFGSFWVFPFEIS